MTSLHAHNKAIIANSESPFVKLHAINFGDCQWTKGFWAEKTQKAVDVMIPYMGDVLCLSLIHI